MNPKRTIQQTRVSIGTAAFDLFVNRELGWIFRPVHQENDFGIDGYLDIVEQEQVTGKALAVQIKCVSSYVAKKTSGGIRYNLFTDANKISIEINKECSDNLTRFVQTRLLRVERGLPSDAPKSPVGREFES